MKRKIFKFALITLASFTLLTVVLSVFIFFYAGLYEFFPSDKKFDISPDIQDKVVIVDGLSVNYRTLGSAGLPDIVFIHGWGGSYDANDQVTTALYKQGFQVFTFEVPGLDRSDTPQNAWTNQDYANYYAKAFKEAGITNPVLVGQSFGGGIVASYASLYPNSLKHLVLVDANTTDKLSGYYSILVKLLGNIFSSVLQTSWIPEGMKSLFVQLMLSVPKDQVSSVPYKDRVVMSMTFTNTHLENQLKKLTTITVPTLLVWGESDTKVPMSQVKDMQESLQNEKLRTLPGGHTVIYRDPEAVAKIIAEEVK